MKTLGLFCSNCGASSLFGTKFKINRKLLKYFAFERLCTECFPKFEEKYKKYLESLILPKDRESDGRSPQYRTIADFPDTKYCPGCDTTKLIKDFYVVKHLKDVDGNPYVFPMSHCKRCHKISCEKVPCKHDGRDKEYQKQYHKTYKRKKKSTFNHLKINTMKPFKVLCIGTYTRHLSETKPEVPITGKVYTVISVWYDELEQQAGYLLAEITSYINDKGGQSYWAADGFEILDGPPPFGGRPSDTDFNKEHGIDPYNGQETKPFYML